MKPIIYSGHRCPPCVRLKQWLEQNNFIDAVEIKYVPEDISLGDFRELGLRTTPSMITFEKEKIANSSNIMSYLVHSKNNNIL